MTRMPQKRKTARTLEAMVGPAVVLVRQSLEVAEEESWGANLATGDFTKSAQAANRLRH